MKTTPLFCIFLALATSQTNAASLKPTSANTNSIDTDDKAVHPHPEQPPTEPLSSDQPPAGNDAVEPPAPDLKTSASGRRNKMFDFFGGFYPHPMMYQNQFFQPQQFYDDSGNADVDEELMSRANRRKQGSGQNSPIFYIRLPPTPYMYVPGMGYISQPPTIRPMAIAPPPPPPPPVVNPFINVPVNFLSNGKPTNVYEWPGASQVNFGQPQYPSYLPNRPIHQQRPGSYRPHKPSNLPDSKITHLKGPYVFNGRPDDIYVLPQSGPQQASPFAINPYSQGFAAGQNDYTQHHHQHDYSSPPHYQQHGDYSSPLHHSHHQQAYNNAPVAHYSGYNPGYNHGYNAGYNSIYSEPLSFY